MNQRNKHLLAPIMAAVLMMCFPAIVRAADDLASREEAALKAAVDHVARCVVRIETLGGLETVDNVLIGSGPTTGLIVSSDGYIITSAFNFAQKPTQIIVDLTDGTRLPAEVVAHDNNRMLVLLKVALEGKNADRRLPVPAAAPVGEMRVGEWAISVGRVYDTDQPNMSVGIISATNRVWGKAIQTDAKVSPANYGGPLIDLEGRVIGVLVPMSPMESGELAGVEWYDSGIGFAVPLEHINRVLERLKRGEDLQPGLMGVTTKPSDPYAGDVVIATCVPKSPARQAGLKAGDKIVEVDGVKVSNQSELKHQLAPRYAGEKIALALLRDNKRVEKSLELVAKLPPYIHPFLGILPRRDAADAADAGVNVRYVYPNSPAAKAGIEPGDRIVSLAGQPITTAQTLQDQVAGHEPLDTVKADLVRGGKSKTVEVKPATLPEAVPDNLPPARESKPATDSSARTVGKITIKIPEAPNDCLAYIPQHYNSHVPHGLVVWLHSSGGLKDQEVLDRWQPVCESSDLILLAPKSVDPEHWQRTEAEFIRKAIDDVLEKYNIDRSRIVVVGPEAGGGMAYLLALTDRDLIRGVAAINAPLPRGLKPPANDPIQRLAIFTTTAAAASAGIEASIKQFRDAKYPVTQLDLGENQRPLNDDELNKLVRWIDTLDRS